VRDSRSPEHAQAKTDLAMATGKSWNKIKTRITHALEYYFVRVRESLGIIKMKTESTLLRHHKVRFNHRVATSAPSGGYTVLKTSEAMKADLLSLPLRPPANAHLRLLFSGD
jgi:hypothetical protein